jgi:hypothetical protein
MNFGASLRELAQLARYAHKAKFCIFSLKYGRPGKACLIIFAPSAMLAWYTQHVRIFDERGNAGEILAAWHFWRSRQCMRQALHGRFYAKTT